jgi:TM2 domain-containing membrane protein YozV
MANVMDILPELTGQEMQYVQDILKNYDNETAQRFAHSYRARRRDPMLILMTCLLGFVGFAGVHRFLINHIGMGILYFFTAGLCFIGTILDLVNYQNLAFEYNRQMAHEVSIMLGSSSR